MPLSGVGGGASRLHKAGGGQSTRNHLMEIRRGSLREKDLFCARDPSILPGGEPRKRPIPGPAVTFF